MSLQCMVVHDRVLSGDVRMALFIYCRKCSMERFEDSHVLCDDKTPDLNLLNAHS